jgi:hypothetical protein
VSARWHPREDQALQRYWGIEPPEEVARLVSAEGYEHRTARACRIRVQLLFGSDIRWKWYREERRVA